MSDPPDEIQARSSETSAVYELRVGGRLGRESAIWFEDMTLQVDESSAPVQTIIRGAIRDEAALYGLINRIRDLGLTLLSVQRITIL